MRRPITFDKGSHAPQRAIDFVRCSYLGLDSHPLVVAGALEAIEAQRSLYWPSDRPHLRFGLLEHLEDTLSNMFCAHAILSSSLLLANLGVMRILASGRLTGGRKPTVVFDCLPHGSLICYRPLVADEARAETIVHNDLDALERLCRSNPAVAYVCDDICSKGGYSRLTELRRLQERYGLFLHISDAHSISIFGRHGEGLARSQFPQVLGHQTSIAASLAEGFGAHGGLLMVGTSEHEAMFRRFSTIDGFSESPNLAAAGAALGSCKIHCSAELGERQRRLAQRIDLFDRRLATAEQGNSLPIRTINVGAEANAIGVARRLLDKGFYTSVTFFPTLGNGTAGISVSMTSDHEASDIERLCDGILEAVVEITGRPYPLR
ncbi:7-keto-8-aminopelargonate synthetase [Bradyrhizobium sp. CCBAU 45394]|uniref:7-keto-8-aminopelargonate synthetase n=1 Tax=Bradyrhizobium sp. CCBAU 45394 TaxID=1325087 RepID=UPI0023049202|nr:7-keto-8-aminopelargonate synthetase [Bradyrhizobium sp. CCBAU 45394]